MATTILFCHKRILEQTKTYKETTCGSPNMSRQYSPNIIFGGFKVGLLGTAAPAAPPPPHPPISLQILQFIFMAQSNQNYFHGPIKSLHGSISFETIENISRKLPLGEVS